MLCQKSQQATARQIFWADATYRETLQNNYDDFAMGMAASYTPLEAPNRRCVTLSMNTQFIKALSPGRAVVEAKQVGGGGKTFFMEAALIDGNGEVCSRAQGVFRLIKS